MNIKITQPVETSIKIESRIETNIELFNPPQIFKHLKYVEGFFAPYDVPGGIGNSIIGSTFKIG